MINDKYQAVLFDFDGVLCHDRFYDATFLADRPEVCAWVNTNVFTDKELTRQWMRGQLSSLEINEFVADGIGMDLNELSVKFDDSIRAMRLDHRLKELAGSLAERGIKVGIVTDNMDVFSSITVPHHGLNDIFDVVVNSSEYGMLKQDENGKLFDVALSALDVGIENALHIDDSPRTVELFRQNGGHGFLYKDFDELAKFLGYEIQ